jgi:hypothetical protein
MKKPKIISANKFFGLLADGNYILSQNNEGNGNEQNYLAFLLKVNRQASVFPPQLKGYCFLKIENNAEIKLFAISGKGEINKIIKPK